MRRAPRVAPAPAHVTPDEHPVPALPEPPRSIAPQIEPGETPDAYFERISPLLAQRAAESALMGDSRMTKWVMEQTTFVRDRYSAPMEVNPEDFATLDGVTGILRQIGANALRGRTGLDETLKACTTVKTVAESMFAAEIQSLQEALARAEKSRGAPVRAHQISHATAGAITVEEAAPQLTWGRFGTPQTIDMEG